MSTIAKQIYLNRTERLLRESMPDPVVQSVVDILTKSLISFDLEEIESSLEKAVNEELIETFLMAKQLEGRSEKTIEHYRYILSKFFKEIQVPAQDLTVFHLRKYMMDEQKRGIKEATLSNERSVFSSFFGWLQKEELLKRNPCSNFGTIKCPKVIKKPYSDVEIEKLKESCTDIRDKALISFLLSTGCRIGEVCDLNRDDVDFQKRECVVFGKGSKERTVFLDDVSLMLLSRYLEQRTDMFDALFVGRGSTRLKPGGIRRMLNRVGETAGVENVHPHRFRRTLATNLINRGMPIQEVAAILGHEKIDTTMRYVYIDKTNVKNSYQKYS